jgi:thiol-disulfide isomerase/thioredoxin
MSLLGKPMLPFLLLCREYLRADDQKGMTVVVDCYTDWCGPCKMIMPDLIAYSAELEPKVGFGLGDMRGPALHTHKFPLLL